MIEEQSSESIGDELARQGLVEADALHETQAKELGMEVRRDLSQLSLDKGWYKKIPYAFVRKHLVLPVREEGNTLVVAVADPMRLEALEELQLMLDRPVRSIYSPKSVLMEAISACYDLEKGAASKLIAHLEQKGRSAGADLEPEVYDLLEDSVDQAPIVKLIHLIFKEAIQQGASDIHFDPTEEGLRVRYRIDGVLQNRHAPAPEFKASLISRIKVMAKLDIAEHRLPQDGRIKLRLGGREVDVRVSTVPVVHGERIVLRILDKGNIQVGLNRVGMPASVLEKFKRLIQLPEGILLVTGPTGSGKTTTLYSAISDIVSDEINIMTVEDPVEYKLKGIAQIGVRPKIGLTFAAGLRHILRQDPDVVMIGEIRDRETAEIAIQASLTGHLVLSTLHTNDAPSALTRLVDMGIEPYLITTSVIGVLAQRLLRRICPECKEGYTPDEEELRELGIRREDLPNGMVYRGRGCAQCFQSGFKGRHGVYELMPMTVGIKRQVLQSPDAVALRNLAVQEGMQSLRAHGAQLVVKGLTTVAEVLRVTRGTDLEE